MPSLLILLCKYLATLEPCSYGITAHVICGTSNVCTDCSDVHYHFLWHAARRLQPPLLKTTIIFCGPCPIYENSITLYLEKQKTKKHANCTWKNMVACRAHLGIMRACRPHLEDATTCRPHSGITGVRIPQKHTTAITSVVLILFTEEHQLYRLMSFLVWWQACSVSDNHGTIQPLTNSFSRHFWDTVLSVLPAPAFHTITFWCISVCRSVLCYIFLKKPCKFSSHKLYGLKC